MNIIWPSPEAPPPASSHRRVVRCAAFRRSVACGGVGLGDDPGYVLRGRLREHAGSVDQAENLELADFHCRYLIVEDIWIPLGESLLIAKFSPIWNILIDGYGNHDPGKGRYKQLRSRWDVLHPGRAWAERCPSRPETGGQIATEVADHLRSRPAT